jgi:hypothetical protein
MLRLQKQITIKEIVMIQKNKESNNLGSVVDNKEKDMKREGTYKRSINKKL